METVLITGGAGFIGCDLTYHLLARGYRVKVLDRFTHRHPGLAWLCSLGKFHPVRGDCRDVDTLKEHLYGTDWIIPLAAVVGAPACDQNKQDAVTTNLGAITALMGLRSKSQRVIFPCTNSGYGVTGDQYATEDTPMRPISLYGRTKCEAEKVVLDREDTLTLRLATVFGASPRMRTDLLVNDFVYRAFRDKFFAVYESRHRRNCVHLHDVSRAFAHSMQNFDMMKGFSYNVASPEGNLTKGELADRVVEQIPGSEWVCMESGADPDQRDCFVSTAKIEATGWEAVVTLKEGIAELVKAYTMMPCEETRNA